MRERRVTLLSTRGGGGTCLHFPPPTNNRVLPTPSPALSHSLTFTLSHTCTLPPCFFDRTRPQEDVAACHVRVGDRVLVRGPLIDGVVKQYTGMVRTCNPTPTITPHRSVVCLPMFTVPCSCNILCLSFSLAAGLLVMLDP